jgi:hypothetical protein
LRTDNPDGWLDDDKGFEGEGKRRAVEMIGRRPVKVNQIERDEKERERKRERERERKQSSQC